METSQDSNRICWICGKLVSLEQCKIDEHGMAVHEDCYTTRITPPQRLPKLPNKSTRV